VPLRTRRREISVVFLDLRGFTRFAETSEPEEVMGVLREYHREMGQEPDRRLATPSRSCDRSLPEHD
jgi:class 3 adenylate cyclase